MSDKKNHGKRDIILNGFIHRYGENDYSIWMVDLSREDEDKIMEILSKYEAEGISIRGDDTLSISDC